MKYGFIQYGARELKNVFPFRVTCGLLQQRRGALLSTESGHMPPPEYLMARMHWSQKKTKKNKQPPTGTLTIYEGNSQMPLIIFDMSFLHMILNNIDTTLLFM